MAIEALGGDAAIEVEAGVAFIAGCGSPEVVVAVEGGGGLKEGLADADEVAGGVGTGADLPVDGVFGGEGAALDAVPEAAVAGEGLEAGLGEGMNEGTGGGGLGGSDGIAHGGAGEGRDLRGVARLAGVDREERKSGKEKTDAPNHFCH